MHAWFCETKPAVAVLRQLDRDAELADTRFEDRKPGHTRRRRVCGDESVFRDIGYYIGQNEDARAPPLGSRDPRAPL